MNPATVSSGIGASIVRGTGAPEPAGQSPVYGYLERPSLVDFPGRMAAVFFTSGCNFRCGFCHNASLLGQRGRQLPWERLASACAQFREQWVEAVVISGGEPTLWPELPRLVAFFRQRGFAVKLDTNGSNPEMLAQLLPQLAYVAMDIKCSHERYPAFVGWRDTARIARSVALLKAWDGEYEFRSTILTSVHNEEEMLRIGDWLDGARRYVLQPFLPHPDLPEPALRQLPRTPPGHLRHLAELLAGQVGELQLRGV